MICAGGSVCVARLFFLRLVTGPPASVRQAIPRLPPPSPAGYHGRANMRNTLVISCHADTGFKSHRLKLDATGDYCGHLDNFVGVYAVMSAYFSGRLDYPDVRIELTYGEESGMAGAYEVLDSLHRNDTVIVVDVTGTRTQADIVIEKCADPGMTAFVQRALDGLSFDLYAGCPDPVANQDESDVYREKLKNVCFLGIPCRGGDYNATAVTATRRSVETAAEALVRFARTFSETSSASR